MSVCRERVTDEYQALPSITTRFHSTTDIGWYAATYPLALCSLQPLAGKIFTLFSLKWTFLVFVCIFLFGSFLCGVAVSSIMFIIGRTVAGAGASGLFSGAMAILLVISPLRKRAIYMGLLASLFGVATVLGPVLGGTLTHKASWRWCFYINLPCGALTIMLLILFFHPPERDTEKKYTVIEKIKQLDIIGSALFIPSIVMILLALQWGGHQHAWKSATIIGLLVGFAGLLTVFLFWEYRRGDNAMVPFSVLLNRSVILCCLFVFLLMGSYLLCVYYLAEWFQAVKGADPLQSGLMQLPSVISQILTSAAGGLLGKPKSLPPLPTSLYHFTNNLQAHRIGYYNPFLFSGAICLSIATGLYTTFTTTTPHAHWISYQVLQGIGAGVGIQMPILTVQVVLSSRPQQIPIGISLVAFFQYFGGSVFQSIALAVFQNRLIKALTYDVELDQNQVVMLLNAGSGGIREAVNRVFPDKMAVVLGAYNKAITTVFVSALISI
jgi:MFS family permease